MEVRPGDASVIEGEPVYLDAAARGVLPSLGEALLLSEQALDVHPDDKNLGEWNAWLLLQLDLPEQAIATGVPVASAWAWPWCGGFPSGMAAWSRWWIRSGAGPRFA